MMSLRVDRLLLLCTVLSFLLPDVALSQSTGTCETGMAEGYVDAANVRARILNNGALFWSGSPSAYTVPQDGNANALFSGSLLMGGFVDGQLRTAASTYGPWEFWPGPHDNALAGNDCKPFDHIYHLTKADQRPVAIADELSFSVRNWPWQLGAPVVDGDGNPNNYDPVLGDRPQLLGDQSLFWIMNDVGNAHGRSASDPLGVEVHSHVFVTTSTENEHFPNSVFYRYVVKNKSDKDISDMYVGMYVDVDLGNYQDDYVGSDTLLGLAFAYNADNDDEGGEGYGSPPPAIGFQVVQGPRADADGVDNNGDGIIDEAGERLRMSSFMMPNNGGGVQGAPGNASDFYNYMQGKWKDGQTVTLGGNGLGFSNIPTSFMFPGNPPGFWSEFDSDGQGSAIAPADRRMMFGIGPFDLPAGEENDFLIASITAFGQDNLDSVSRLKEATTSFIGLTAETIPTTDIGPLVPDAAPTITSPGFGASGQPVPTVVSWSWPGSAALKSIVEVRPSSDPSSVKEFRTTGRSLKLELETDTEYIVRVRLATLDGMGPWSETVRFSTGNFNSKGVDLITDFVVTQNASGQLDPPIGAAADWQGFPGTGSPTSDQQTTGQKWLIHAGGSTGSYENFLSRWLRNGVDRIAGSNWEIRFTGAGKAIMYWGSGEAIDVPFELWSTGEDPIDPADDKQYVPLLLDEESDGIWGLAAKDHPVSEGSDDPYTDWIYWYEGNYEAEVASGFDFATLGNEIVGRTVLVALDAGDVSDGTLDAIPAERRLPEIGTVFRIETTPPPSPIPSAPAEGQIVWSNRPVVFSWWAWREPTTLLRVSTSADMSDIFWETSNVQSNVSSPMAFPPGEYFWQVTDVTGGTSPIVRFEAGTPPSNSYSADPVFSAALNFSDGQTSQTLIAGMSSAATNGYDQGIDQFAPPPPPSGVMDTRFVRDGENYTTDIVASVSGTVSWMLGVSHGSNPITMSWSEETLPSVGSLRLRDTLGGGIVDVFLTGSSSVEVPSGLTQLELIYNQIVNQTTPFNSGWNIVGLSVEPPTSDYTVLFPEALSQTLFEFSGSYSFPSGGYLSPGTGYWLRYGENVVNTIEGAPIFTVSTSLRKGWNLISPPNCDFSIHQVTPSAALLPGTLYGYAGGYNLTSEMKPGYGYWIRASESANITMDCNVPPAPPGKRMESLDLTSFAHLRVQNADWQPSNLFITNSPSTRIPDDAYTIPPRDPHGRWQPAFEDGRYVSVDGAGMIDLSLAEYPLSFSLAGTSDKPLHLAFFGPEGRVDREQYLNPGEPLILIDSRYSAFKLSTDMVMLPADFAVHPVFPNPASAKATFVLDLPEAERVSAEMFDMLGRRVAILTSNELMKAGSHRMSVETHHLSSGTYVVRINADSGTRSLKMTVLK